MKRLASLSFILLLTAAAGCKSGDGGTTAGKETAAPAVTQTAIPAVSGGGKVLSGTIASLTFEHPKLKAVLGEPAVLSPGDAYPKLKFKSVFEGTVSGTVLFEDGSIAAQISSRPVKANEEITINIDGNPLKPGRYEMRVKLSVPGSQEVSDGVYFTLMTPEQQNKNTAKSVFIDDKGKLKYVPDYKGNTIPDFSNVGYMGGGVKLPDVPVKATVQPGDGDDGARIQAAIDQVSGLEPDKDGFRGTILMKKGLYKIAGSVKISKSGVVLRGEGQGEDGTVLLGTGTAKRAIVQVNGSAGAKTIGSPVTITDLYVPVGARSFNVKETTGLKVGDPVLVRKVGNKDFISFLKMDKIAGRPGDPKSTQQWGPFNLDFDRVITAIDGNRITIDAPIVDAIDSQWGGGMLYKSTDAGRIEKVGIENMRGDSEYDKKVTKTDGGKPYFADENHAQDFILLNNVKNSWVRDMTALHFWYSAVEIGKGAKWNTVQDATNLEMVSVLDGGKRYPFNINGELNLLQRLYSKSARHAFVYGSQVKGPNVVLQAVSEENHATSEPHHRWSVGGLFDNVSAPIAVQDRQYFGSGHGWAGANYVLWNTTGPVIAQKPPTAQTWVIGHLGTKNKGSFEPRDPAFFASFGTRVEPRSLYLKQLEDRLGRQAVDLLGTFKFPETFDDKQVNLSASD